MNKIFEIATNISNPLMLAGFFAAAFFFIVRQIIKSNIFPRLTKQLSGDIIKLIIQRLFTLALTAMILGFIAYVIGQFNDFKNVPVTVKKHYEEPADDLIRLVLSDFSAIDFSPRPDQKNITLRFKVIPKSKDKFVPLKNKGEFVTIDSIGRRKTYIVDVNLDEEGIKPQVPSTIFLDGFIPFDEYEAIMKKDQHKAQCTVFYDNDIMPTKVKYQSAIIPFNRSVVNISQEQPTTPEQIHIKIGTVNGDVLIDSATKNVYNKK